MGNCNNGKENPADELQRIFLIKLSSSGEKRFQFSLRDRSWRFWQSLESRMSENKATLCVKGNV